LTPAARRLREQINAEIRHIRERNASLRALLQNDFVRVVQQGGIIIADRAKEILTEKGHIVTGNLRRSISSQVVAVNEGSVDVEVGTWLVYAPKIEALPDGGFLYPAAEETFDEVTRFLTERGVNVYIQVWSERRGVNG